MSELNQVYQLLDRTAARRRLLAGWSMLWRTLILAGAGYLFVLALYKVAPIGWQVVAYAGWVGLAVDFSPSFCGVGISDGSKETVTNK